MLKTLNRNALMFTLYALILLTLTRIGILCYFGAEQHPAVSELLTLFFMGFRFDIKLIATLLLLVLYLPSLLLLPFQPRRFLHVERVLLLLLLMVLSLFSFIELGYYLFFGNGIDLLIFGLIEDGTSAVISSIFGDWRLMVLTLAALLFMLVLSTVFMRQYTTKYTTDTPKPLWKTYGSVLGIILLLAVLARGSFDTFPLSRKVINTNDNAFLNTLILNPVWHFYYALRDRNENDFTLTGTKILKTANVADVTELLQRAGYGTTRPLQATTPSNSYLQQHPPHVIFVLLEGWSTHPTLEHGPRNNILGAFAKHAQEDYFYPSFFSNAYGTNPTIENLLLNSPIKGISQSRATKISFALSSVRPFKTRGYHSLFLSGGSSSWRNHNQFWPRQGFDEYIGRSGIEKYFDVTCDNPWGVYDEYLFSYLKERLMQRMKSDEPSFTFVLTTNNHAPIRLPHDFKAPPFDLKALGFDADDTLHHDMLRGYHYQINAFGKFLDWLKASPLKDQVIVVATGDHILKGYHNYTASKMQYLKYAVPAYFYVPEAYDRLRHVSKEIVGSHEDLFPTLYELALSETRYYNFGTPVMYKEPLKSFGWNEQHRYLFNNGVVTPDMQLHPFETPQRKYLQVNSVMPSPFQRERIERNRYEIALKTYLLVKEYEDKR